VWRLIHRSMAWGRVTGAPRGSPSRLDLRTAALTASQSDGLLLSNPRASASAIQFHNQIIQRQGKECAASRDA
jgi:hypothetical protein